MNILRICKDLFKKRKCSRALNTIEQKENYAYKKYEKFFEAVQELINLYKKP